jgi:short-subunit dehydrogenase
LPNSHAAVDVGEDGGCDSLSKLPVSAIDTLILNAGTLEVDTLGALTSKEFDDMKLQFNVNALGPLRCVQAVLPKLKEGSKVLLVGSKLGTFQSIARGGGRVRFLANQAAAAAP